MGLEIPLLVLVVVKFMVMHSTSIPTSSMRWLFAAGLHCLTIQEALAINLSDCLIV